SAGPLLRGPGWQFSPGLSTLSGWRGEDTPRSGEGAAESRSQLRCKASWRVRPPPGAAVRCASRSPSSIPRGASSFAGAAGRLPAPGSGWGATPVRLSRAQGIRARITERANHQVVYLKEGDGIVRALSLMGASRAVMEFENARVVREVSGQVNRRLNFETANIDKTIGSAMRQVAAIETLENSGRLDTLPPALREIARARRAHPDLQPSDPARRHQLSKSAVNHRLRRLMEIAET